LELLRARESATATHCAQGLHESVPSCAYHLAILAKYGFIEVAPGGHGREKPWRLAEHREAVPIEDLLGVQAAVTGGAGGSADVAAELRWDHEYAQLHDALRRRAAEPREWQRSLGLESRSSWLTASELAEVNRAIREIVVRYEHRALNRTLIPDGAREVRIVVGISVAAEPGQVS